MSEHPVTSPEEQGHLLGTRALTRTLIMLPHSTIHLKQAAFRAQLMCQYLCLRCPLPRLPPLTATTPNTTFWYVSDWDPFPTFPSIPTAPHTAVPTIKHFTCQPVSKELLSLKIIGTGVLEPSPGRVSALGGSLLRAHSKVEDSRCHRPATHHLLLKMVFY